MKLTTRLLGYLNRVFNKKPMQFLALSLAYDGGMTWVVSDGILTTSVVGGSGASLSIDLSTYTLQTLVQYLAAQPGYTTTFLTADRLGLSALVLIDSTGDLSVSGGGDFYGYTSTLWSFLEAYAAELTAAQTSIEALPAEMSTTTADSAWLDMLGAYYDVKRQAGELDSSYGPRIIATVIRPASNNVALELAIETYTGQEASVVDVVTQGVTGPKYDGTYEHNSAVLHNAHVTLTYGLFDVTYGYDLINGGDLTSFQNTVVALINILRAAGTHLRAIALTGSVLSDSLTPPTDAFSQLLVAPHFADTLTAPKDAVSVMPLAMAPFADTLTRPTDGIVELDHYSYTYGGTRTHNGMASYNSGEHVLTPAPSIDWSFYAGSLDPSLTFARASTATYFDATGMMQTAAAGVPRFDHDPSSGLALGLLLEESRTNQVPYSQAFDAASWTVSAMTVTPGAAVAPDGSLTAYKLADDSTTGSTAHSLTANLTSLLASSTWTTSIFASASDRRYLVIRLVSNTTTTNYCYGYFDLVAGTFIFGSSGVGVTVAATMIALGNGWYRCSVSGAPDTSGTGLRVFFGASLLNTNSTVYVGVPGAGIYVWGAQLEAGAFVTSYIPTPTAAAVTRAAEAISGPTSSWLSSAGTLALEYAETSLAYAQNAVLFVVSDGTNNNRIGAYQNPGSTQRLLRDLSNNAGVSVSEASSYTVGRHRMAVAFGQNYNYARDGSLLYSASGVPLPPGLSTISMGMDMTSSFPFTGWIRRLTYAANELDPTPLAMLTAA